MKHKFGKLFAVVTAAAVFLTACGGGNNPVSKFASVSYQQVLVYKAYYAETYPVEAKYSASFDAWWAYVDNGLGQLKDMKFLSDNCYSNVLVVLENGTIGIYDNVATADGAGNGVLNPNSLISALVTNQLYPANADECSKMLQATLAEVVKIRQNTYEKQVAFIEIRRTLKVQYDGTVDTAVQRRFLDLYGVEFIAYMNDLLGKNGVDPFPADFIGFPTSGVEVHTKSRTWCGYYQDIANGVAQPGTPGMSREMYGAAWIGPENGGECMLTRQAAWEFTGRTFQHAATSNAVACGEAAPGLSETVDENCNTVQNDPNAPTQPVATPKP